MATCHAIESPEMSRIIGPRRETILAGYQGDLTLGDHVMENPYHSTHL